MAAGDDDDLLREAMRGVVPLGDRERAVVKPAKAIRPVTQPPVSFTVNDDEGRAPGVNKKELAKLRSGGFEVEHRLDLHRARADAAKQLVVRHIGDAVAQVQRCVLIVHGKGLHSGGAPVLRELVVQVLTSGACAKHVLAFCPALPKHGGRGATYVLLRRR